MQIHCSLLRKDFSKGFSVFFLLPKLQQEQNFLCSKEQLESPAKLIFKEVFLSMHPVMVDIVAISFFLQTFSLARLFNVVCACQWKAECA